ncbi:MAG: hypothetical protein ACI9VS_003392 [Candidatus Binatia bacterium]|jgi:hypothetical protein
MDLADADCTEFDGDFLALQSDVAGLAQEAGMLPGHLRGKARQVDILRDFAVNGDAAAGVEAAHDHRLPLAGFPGGIDFRRVDVVEPAHASVGRELLQKRRVGHVGDLNFVSEVGGAAFLQRRPKKDSAVAAGVEAKFQFQFEVVEDPLMRDPAGVALLSTGVDEQAILDFPVGRRAIGSLPAAQVFAIEEWNPVWLGGRGHREAR